MTSSMDEIEAWLCNEEKYAGGRLGQADVNKLVSLVRVFCEENKKLKYALVQYAAGKDLRSIGNFNDYCDANKRYAQKVLLEAHAAEENAKEIVRG